MTTEKEKSALAAEVRRRIAVQASNAVLVGKLKKELFDKQLAFVDDAEREKAALCTRRAGKTAMWARYARIVTLERPRCIVRIWGITRLRAEQLIWNELKLMDARHGIECQYNETKGIATLPNGSEIRLLGADKDKEVEKKRGDKTALEIVLEAQMFGAYLENLVENVAKPCLFDLQGTFCLEGTPGPICTGYWWNVSGGENFLNQWTSPGGKDGSGAGWKLHRWSVLDNPHIPHARTELAAIKAKRRWADDNPTYVREWLGRWVNDLGVLFYKFDPVRNTFTTDEVMPWGPGWEHTLGWDLGSRDDMALVVWGWHPTKPELYEAFSWKEPGALSNEVMEKVFGLEKAGFTSSGAPRAAFNFVKKVADTGGGGKMYVEDVMSRYSVSFEAAQKQHKYEHVRLFNDDLLTGFVKLQRDSVYAQEIASLARDLDWPPPESPDKPPREDQRLPNHCSDAGLYAYRGAWHYLHQPLAAKAAPGTNEFWAEEAKRLEERVLQHVSGPPHATWDDETDREATWDE